MYRSFNVGNRFPLNILPTLIKGFYTFIFPGIFLGTYPVLIVAEWGLLTTLKFLGIELLILLFWIIILCFLWGRGVKKYESYGG